MDEARLNPIFPPRPGITLPYKLLNEYPPETWLAQRKFNGIRNLIYISADREVTLWTRHEENKHQHRRYTLPEAVKKDILHLHLEDGIEYIIDSELLHTRTKAVQDAEVPQRWRNGVRNTIVLFDLLYAGEYLADWSQTERLALLADICSNPTDREQHGRALIVSDHLWLAETINDRFEYEYFNFFDCPEIEGLVLRRRDSTLREDNPMLGGRKHDVSWMVRVRKPSKVAQF